MNGGSTQYIDGAGDLVTFPAIPFDSLTTAGTTGAATLISGVLNIPQYTGGGGMTSFNVAGNSGSGTIVNSDVIIYKEGLRLLQYFQVHLQIMVLLLTMILLEQPLRMLIHHQ